MSQAQVDGGGGFGGSRDQGGPVPDSEYRKLLDSKSNMKGTFIVRCKVDTYTMGSQTEENKVRYYLAKFAPYDLADEDALLLDRLRRYTQHK